MFINDILQPTHMLLILAVALLVLGPKRLPEVGRAVGRTIHGFKGAINGESPGTQDPALGTEAAPHSPASTDRAV
jgi:sec-independent protein translocase protein TatA